MTSLWRRLPVVVRALLAGMAAAVAGSTPWALLVSANLEHWPTVPWAVLPTALLLWVYWRYLRGEGWPAATAAARRESCRANRVPDDAWGMAIFAGLLGLLALVLFLNVVNRMVRLPAQQMGDVSHVPVPTLFTFLIMSAIVAGVVEESAFRGYMQGPIERRHGPTLAILVTGASFGFLHLSHPEVTVTLLPYYMAVAAVYGALAWLTNSIYPSMLLHAGGNVFSSLGLLTTGRGEWQASAKAQPLIWETGADADFWLGVVIALVAAAAAVWAYAGLAAVRHTPSTEAFVEQPVTNDP
jgi:membrane protease YdiL (CAAX protease family)